MDPRQEYERRRDAAEAAIARLRARFARVSWLRAAGFGAAIGLWFVGPWWSLIGAGNFVAAILWHRSIDGERARQERLRDWYRRALQRLDGAWDELDPSGTEWLDAEHPCAGEIDLLGARSLFARICHAATTDGRARLAAWLCEPAQLEELRARQDAVDELCAHLDAREAMWLATPRRQAPPESLLQWVRLPAFGGLALPSALAFVCALALSLSLGLWLAGRWSALPLVVLLAPAYLLARWLGSRLTATTASLDVVRSELRAVEALLSLLESQQFACERLRRIAQALRADSLGTRARLRSLHRLADWYDAARNAFFAPLAALWLWRVQLGLRIEAWRRRHGAALLEALDALADYQALQSLARHAFENPELVRPEVDAAATQLHARELAHPLLPSAVANDLHFDERCRLYVVSGSNMSGKSTWLRTIGVNVALAMCGGRVRARSLSLPPLAVAASLRASDSLAAGESRFAAELHRLRIVLGESERRPRLLFLLDELFHGTHSHDRREGARAYLRRLLDGGHLGLVTTHDLALTELDQDWAGFARNVHFRDDVADDRAVFDYRVHEGVVQHSNALRLMRAQGLI